MTRTKEELAQTAKLLIEGLSVNQVARLTSIPKETVSRWRGRLNIVPEGQVTIAEMYERIKNNPVQPKVEAETRSVSLSKDESRERYVYLAQESWQGLIKIGLTEHLQRRLSSLHNSCPQTITFLVYRHGTGALLIERALHERFKEKRHKNEWFRLSDEDIESIIRDHEGFVRA